MNLLRKLFIENAGLKLLSLALAVALWAAVGSDPVTEATFRVPLEFTNVPANLEVLTDQPSVQLWARGPSHAVRQAEPGDFVVRLNVAPSGRPGERTFSLDPASVTAPASLQVVELNPSQVRVSLERTASREVPIEPQFSGEPAPGYRMRAFRLKPSLAQIAGPGSHVSPITTATTDPIDLTQLSATKTLRTNVYIPDPLVRFLQPRAVEVTVEIERAEAQGTGER